MSDPTTQSDVDAQAAEWFTRLGERRVSTPALEAFYVWRAEPRHAEAYRRMEALWSQSRALSGSPAIQDAVRDALDRAAEARRRRHGVFRGAIAGVALAVAAAFAASFWWTQVHGVHATRIGEQELVRLADGSQVQLDTDSRIRVRLSNGVRRVQLIDGQALFTVAHDAARPFVVSVGDVQVTAIGTVFDVRRTAGGASVTLVSGAVDVRPAPDRPAARLTPGQQAAVGRQGAVTRPINAVAAVSWTEGRLIFEDTPLSVAVAEMNRYLADPVRLDAPGLERTPVNGTFRAGDREAFVAATSDLFRLRAEPMGDGGVLLRPDGKKSSPPPG